MLSINHILLPQYSKQLLVILPWKVNLREKKNSCAGWVQGGELFVSLRLWHGSLPRNSAKGLSQLSHLLFCLAPTHTTDLFPRSNIYGEILRSFYPLCTYANPNHLQRYKALLWG